jgi:hypothetical protein
MKSTYATKLVPFYRFVQGREAKRYIMQRKQDHDARGDTLTAHLGEEGFLDRAIEGREGTVMVMWKRRFLFGPKGPKKQDSRMGGY